MKSTDYSLEQKAKAFDLLWVHAGHGVPEFSHYRLALSAHKQIRIPVYEFRLWFDDHCNDFKDVLHALATKE